jgi:hypothetical protein
MVVSVEDVIVDVWLSVAVEVTVPPGNVLVSVLVIVFVAAGPVIVAVVGGAVTVEVALVVGFAT